MEEYIKKLIGTDLMIESVKYIMVSNLKNSVLENYTDDIDQYYINCLVVGDTDILINELNEKELKLLSDLQKLNISLIKNQTPEQKRKQMLFEYSQNFKIINNI
jgi:hypothetical protein